MGMEMYDIGGLPIMPYCAVIYCYMPTMWHDDISEHDTFLFHSRSRPPLQCYNS